MVLPHTTTPARTQPPANAPVQYVQPPANAPVQYVTPPGQVTPAKCTTLPPVPKKTPMSTPSAPAAKRQRTENGYMTAARAATRATFAHPADASPTPVAHGMKTRKRAREVSADSDADVAEAVAQLDVQELAWSSSTQQQQP
ncbi:hypothetical protein AMAG_09502 [Allomyces macrogynus ATCC 38327]|uniref:Uncharacterized protein n=1 Tax=Allomyces macrogynus (strain ATCC 38327) TaxID=578462 RepID=A0A0L0SQ70_ALLM3|nr:hypothetical protein AMAG_09502 [Allomyces macrogynus ATCC 38327]|eukprot:KNE64485.1 hypothetical protein AMAG_09502 [Allomyces macrogynus ATCC 38327]